MSVEVATLEAEIEEYKLQLATVKASLQADPSNAELENLQHELEEVISLTNTTIAELKPAPVKNTSISTEKWSKDNHPAYQAGYKSTNNATPQQTNPTFSVNDVVLAKWKSGDRGFYPARITSITGSSSKPVYTVTFKSYDNTETLSAHEIKAISNQTGVTNTSTTNTSKRKADTFTPVSSATPIATAIPAPAPLPGTLAALQTSSTISASPSIDTSLASQVRQTSELGHRVSDGPIRPAKVPRKVKANKELEAGKSKWQAFSAKGPGSKSSANVMGSAATGGFANGMGKKPKESMFRTGEGVSARVGFTGSGQAMRKDQTRSRHVYSQAGDGNNKDEY